jgi:hypothetical protein
VQCSIVSIESDSKSMIYLVMEVPSGRYRKLVSCGQVTVFHKFFSGLSMG